MPILTNAIITAYCACKLCCGLDASGITARGNPPREGITIAGPRNIPLGTTVLIGRSTYTVEDRTALKYDGRFDIYFRSHKQAKQFGIRRATVIVRGAGCGVRETAKKGKKK